jgi:glycerophosphoryl diester phosphodiesterase
MPPLPMPTLPMPSLVAHRGMPRRHRENTLPGFLAAMACGADGWELDVHATRDGVVVVHHDAELPPQAGALAGRRLADMDWDELRRATVGAAGETIPTLDDVLDAANGITVYVEVKAPGIEDFVQACLSRHTVAPCAVHSFDHRVALSMHRRVPALPVGILTDSYLIDPAHALRSAGARDYWPHRSLVDQALVDAIHAVSGRVIVWTVNDPRDARRLAALGVDGLCTDVVDELRAALTDI